MKHSIVVGVLCWMAGYTSRDLAETMMGEWTGGEEEGVGRNYEVGAKGGVYSVHPLRRELGPAVALPKNYSCVVFAADSIAWSKMRKGIYGYPQFTTSILQSAGYSGEAVVQSSPGLGLLDLLSLPGKDYLTEIVNTTTQRSCSGVVVQLGINDAFKHATPATFLSVYRNFVASLRSSLPEAALVLTSITPCTTFPGGTGRWLHEVNLGISEVAVSVQGIFTDTHWGLLREMRGSKKRSWHGILDDHVHPTHHARYLIGRSIAGSILAKPKGYPTSFTCGEEVHWLGYIFKPAWGGGKEWDCAGNPRIVVVLTNTSLAFGELPVAVSVSPPWGSIFGRMPVFGTFSWRAETATNATYGARFEYTLGGPPIWLNLQPRTTALEIRLEREYTNWKPPVNRNRPPPPPPLRPVNPPSDYKDTLHYLQDTFELRS